MVVCLHLYETAQVYKGESYLAVGTAREGECWGTANCRTLTFNAYRAPSVRRFTTKTFPNEPFPSNFCLRNWRAASLPVFRGSSIAARDERTGFMSTVAVSVNLAVVER
jgi:hypothetical protein